MKYIKKFESIEKEKFWIIPIDQPHLDFALKKIGMSPDNIYHWLDLLATEKGQEILLFKGITWSYSGITARDHNGIPYINNPDYENMGRVFIEDYEVEANKYNL